MNKFKIWLGKYGLIPFMISILLFIKFINLFNPIIRILGCIYIVTGTLYLGNLSADTLYLNKLNSEIKPKTK